MTTDQKHKFIYSLEWITNILGTPSNCREVAIINVRTGRNITGAITHYDPEVTGLRELLAFVLSLDINT